MDEVTIYTDGACSGNPGQGGWGAVLLYKGVKKEISGHDNETTNNRMEMTAIIKALLMLKRPCKVLLHSDSSYIVDAFNKNWTINWQRNGWRTANKKEVKNIDLWEQLIELSKTHDVKWIKVKGHSNDKYNNLADKLATSAIKKC